MKTILCNGLLVLAYSLAAGAADVPKTIFQVSSQWMPEIDVPADGVMVYGAGDRPGLPFAARAESWRAKGYRMMFMTGTSWGRYEDYFAGRWDGLKTHLDEGQKRRDGRIRNHPSGIPYIVPTASFIKYMKERHVKPVIDAGIDSYVLEEPEFWSNAGYSEAFKREWKARYGTEWQDPARSAANAYRANELKHFLYRRAIGEILSFAKSYGREKGLDVKCYVATHSPVNYPMWGVVSPEASLATLDCVDGYIAQVWTGTARPHTRYRSREGRSRTFETALCEYAATYAMVAPTGRKCWFLTDPVEDAHRDWTDYRLNYQATFAAQLMVSACDRFQVLPWPNRIYTGTYKVLGKDKPERIPAEYAVQMQTMICALGDIRASKAGTSGTKGVTVAMSDTMMFQRTPIDVPPGVDWMMGDFFGQAYPFIKRGTPVDFLHLENAPVPDAFEGTRLLVLSYAGMKPPTATCHEAIAAWVKDGGALLYCSADDDPYQTIPAWWNNGGRKAGKPSEELFARLDIPADASAGTYSSGKGRVTVIRDNPGRLATDAAAEEAFFATANAAYEKATGKPIATSNHFTVKRGPYVCVAVMDESVSEKPATLNGMFIDLFDSGLPIVKNKTIAPGGQAFLYDLSRPGKKAPAVLCGSARISGEDVSQDGYVFTARCPKGTRAVLRVLLKAAPSRVSLNGNPAPSGAFSWDNTSRTLLLSFDNSPEGVTVDIRNEPPPISHGTIGATMRKPYHFEL